MTCRIMKRRVTGLGSAQKSKTPFKKIYSQFLSLTELFHITLSKSEWFRDDARIFVKIVVNPWIFLH